MDFKIKMRPLYRVMLVFVLLIIFLFGFVCGAALSTRDFDVAIPVAASTILVLIVFNSYFSTMSRHNAEVDIDSFTEAEIENKLEERWNKIKQQAISQK